MEGPRGLVLTLPIASLHYQAVPGGPRPLVLTDGQWDWLKVLALVMNELPAMYFPVPIGSHWAVLSTSVASSFSN